MKHIFKFLILALFVESAFGQGTFLFRNYHMSAGLDAPVFDASGNRLSGTHYVAVLYGGATPDSMTLAQAGAGDMPPESLTAVYNGQPGYFSALGRVIIPTAQFAWLQVRVWDSRLGSTYDEVESLGLGGYGASPLFQAMGGDIEATGRPPQPLIGLQSFSLVPEPGTWALLAFGAGILFWRCRRRPR
jgi:hypothetical protein